MPDRRHFQMVMDVLEQPLSFDLLDRDDLVSKEDVWDQKSL